VAQALFAVLPRRVADLAATAIAALRGTDVRPSGSGLAFNGGLDVAYRVLLGSRLASRLLLPLWRVPAGSSQAYYDAVRALPWERHFLRGATFAVDARARGDREVHTHFVALRTKDAIVDRLRERWGVRPDVDLERPALRVHVLMSGGEAQLALDLSGEPLHRRGYRGAAGAAPLKENVAAAMLLRAGWPAIAKGGGATTGGAEVGRVATGAADGGAFVDPMCGAGTLLVEAAWIAGDVAPGLLRGDEAFGLRGWRGHDAARWRVVRAELQRRREAGRRRVPPMRGSDRDGNAVERARASLAGAGVEGVELVRADVGEATPPSGAHVGLVATNAPYGHRLGETEALRAVYRRLGEALKERFDGWSVALLTADASLAGELRLRASRRNALWNGALRCELLQYRIGRESIPGRER